MIQTKFELLQNKTTSSLTFYDSLNVKHFFNFNF